MAEEFNVAVKLHADASQYTAEFDRAGLTAQAFTAQLQGEGKQAASGLQAVATQAEKIGTAVSTSGRTAAAALEKTASSANSAGTALRTAGTQGAEGLERVAQASKGVQASQTQATAAGTQFIAGLREQITLSGKSADELLRYRAAQSGVAAEAAPLILQWKNQRAAQELAAEAARKEEAAQREASAAKQRAQSAGEAFMASLRDQVGVTGKSTEELLLYRAAQAGVASQAAPLISQLQSQRTALQAAAEAARLEEAAQREATAAKQRAQGAADSFIASLREQAAMQGKSAADVMRYRAAQLGVADASESYIQAIEKASGANGKAALTAGQHAQAMRMLPMQMTDVVTSVASGMPIWMVAIQQGGQVKDSFNGIGNAFKAVGSLITPTVAGIGLLAGAAALAAVAYHQGSSEADDFRNAIVMNGGVAGVTVSQMTDMAKAIGEVTGGQHAASAALTEMAAKGSIAGDSLQSFTQVAMDLEKYAGQPVKTTAEHMAQLGEAPVKASIKLNEQYHYLTDAVYQQIKALETNGQKDEAAALAQKTYADAMAERTGTLKANLGTLERVWESLGSAATKTWNAMLNVGRSASLSEIRTEIDKTTRELNELFATTGTTTAGGAYFDLGARQRASKIAALQKQLGDLSAKAAPLEAEDAQAQLKAQQQAEEDRKSDARQRTDELRKSVRTRAEIRKDEIKQLDIDRATLNLSQQDYDKMLAGIKERHKDPKASTAGQINVTDTQLDSQKSQLEAAKLYHQQLLTLGTGASELNTAERESLKIAEQIKLTTNAKTLAKLAEAKSMADSLGLQLRSNEGLEKSFKAQQTLIDGNHKEAESIRQRAKDQEAANSVSGKGRTAIEQMTLATLKNQMAEAQGSDRFDPKYIASLEEKISAQQRWVDALGQADYKAVMAHADELLRNAQDLSKVYADEAALSGLTGLEREKIVAARQVELKYAKELDAVNKSTLSDEEKQVALEAIKKARGIESAAAVAKAQQSHMAKADEEINKSLTDALMRGFESGKGFAENFADTVKNMFNTMVLRPVISAIMAPVSGVINGVVQSGLNAVGLGGGGSNLMGLAQNASSLYNTGSTVAGWLGFGGSAAASGLGLSAGAGIGLSAASAGSSAIGAGLGMSGAAGWGGIGAGAATSGLGLTASSAGAGAIGAGLGTSAAATGAGAAAGAGSALSGVMAAAPYLAAAVALYAIIKGMDDSGTPHSGAGAIYSKATGVQDGAGIYNQGTFGMGHRDEYSATMQEGISGIAKGLGQTLDAFAVSFGKTAGYSVATAFADDSSKDGSWGSLKIADELGKVLVNWEDSRASKWAPREFADGEEGYKEYLSAVAVDVKAAFLTMDLPEWANQALKAATDIDTLTAALQQISTVKSMFDGFGKTMEMFANLTGDAQTRLLAESGGAEAMASNVGAFYESFYTEGQRAQKQRELQMSALGNMSLYIDPYQGDAAKEMFRLTVEEAMESGQYELGASLMAMSASFRETADYGQSLLDATATAAKEAALDAAAAAASWTGLGQVLAMFSGISADTQARLLAEAGSMDALVGGAQDFNQGFYSGEERQLRQRQTQMAALAGMGLYIDPAEGDAAKAAFKKTVEEAMATGQVELAVKLQAMSGAFAETADYAQQFFDNMKDAAAQAAAQSMSGAWSNFGTMAGLAAQYTGNTSGLSQQLGVVQGSYANATTTDGRVAALQQIINLEQGLWNGQQAARQAEAAAASARANAAREQVNAAKQLLSAAQGLGDYAKSLNSSEASGLSNTERLAALQGQRNELLAKANAGDTGGMQELQSITSSYLALQQQMAVSQADYSVLSGRIAAELAATAAIQEASASSRVSQAERQIAAAESVASSSAEQFKVSAATQKLIDELLVESATAFETEAGLTQKLIDQGAMTASALQSLPAELSGAIGASLIPAIAGLASAVAAATRMDGSHADGLSRVPFDGYRAILHEGEEVVPADEVARRRSAAWTAIRAPAPQFMPTDFYGSNTAADDSGRLAPTLETLAKQFERLQTQMKRTADSTESLLSLTQNVSGGGEAQASLLTNVNELAQAIAVAILESQQA